MNSILMFWRRISVSIASLAVLLVCLVASASAQDIAVNKSTESSVVAANSDVTYQVTVSNSTGSTGPTTLTDTVPANMTFVSAVAPEGWNCITPAAGSGGTITCTYAADLPDESVFPFTFVFHVNPATENGTQIINTASIANEADNNPSNDTSPVMVTVGEPPPPPPPPLSPKEVLFSEFRLSGPNGTDDKYIELYCNRDADCDLSGARLRAHNPNPGGEEGDFLFTLPAPVVIPARHFLLIGDSAGYSLNGYGLIDIDMEGSPDFIDNQGFQLVAGDEGTVLDSVGFAGGGNEAQFVEGAGLQQASSRPADQYAYVRKRTLTTNGLPQDTDNNANDFVLVSVTGTAHAGITAPPVLGAPGPKGLTSPFSYKNSQVNGALVDPTKSKDDDPNRVRVGGDGSGTLSIRRSFTNNTNNTFDYLSFRVIEITTLNSPTTFGEEQAQVRLVSSGSTSAEVPSRGGSVTINGTVLEYDGSCDCPQPQQPNGGGLNSSVAVQSQQFIMGPGQTVDVQFLLNVIKSGFYRFYVYVEAGPVRGGIPSAPELGARRSRVPSKATAPRKFASVSRLPGGFKKPSHETPVITPLRTSPGRLTTPASNAPTFGTVKNTPTPRVIIINRGIAEGEKKPRKKTRVRRKNSAALKKNAEERFAREKLQN
jgi:uncharacterized repeat protein (TIGR01451 family)